MQAQGREGGHHKEERGKGVWGIGAMQWHDCVAMWLYVPVKGIVLSRLYAELAKGGVSISYDHPQSEYKHGQEFKA